MKINKLAYFNMRALFMGIGIFKILSLSKEYTLISILIGTVLGVIFLYFYKNHLNNKFINIIVNSSLILIGLMILINMISSHYLNDTPKLIIGFPLLLLLLYVSNKKYKVLLRLSNILFVINICIFFISFLSLIPHIDFSSFYYTNTSFIKVLLGSLYYMLLSITPTLVVKNNDDLIRTYLLSTLTLLFWFIITYSVLGSYLVDILRYPEYVILKNVKLGSGIENIENIISFMWMIDVIMLLINSVMNLKDCFKDIKNVYLTISILFVIVSLFNINYVILNFIYNNILIIISLLFLMCIISNKKTHY